MKLEVVVTKKQGVFIKDVRSETYSVSSLIPYLFDGKHPRQSFNKHWFIIDKIPTKIEEEVRQSDINHRYELINKELVSDKIPLGFIREDVAYYEDCCWHFKDEYKHLQSLYNLVSDPQPNIMKEVEFEIVAQVDIDEVEEYKGFEFPVYKTRWKHEGDTKITEKNVRHQLLDRLVFPDLVLPARPCKLTSKQTFDIIRRHVSEHIDGKWAKVTSDYDFCFTVKKVIPLHETIKYTVDVNCGTRRKPKYQERYQDTREVIIFEMTHSEANYKGYIPIEPFSGNNEEELGDNIKEYLNKLMENINKPLKECQHCKGKGVIMDG